MSDKQDLENRLTALKLEHRDLDDAITAMSNQGKFDQLKLQRLKKRKLWLRDMISLLRAQLTPDIIA